MTHPAGLQDDEVLLERRSPDCIVPLTATQRRHWYGTGAGARPSTRIVALATRLLGELDIGLLRECLDALTTRHESLRTRIVGGATPTQQIDPPTRCAFDIVDLRALPAGSSQAEARRFAQQCTEEPVQLTVGPLFKATLLRLSAQEQVLVLAADHIIADALSCAILSQELWQMYERGARGLPTELSAPQVQFGDYAVWQSRTYAAWSARHATYWKERLRDAIFAQLPAAIRAPGNTARTSATAYIPFGKQVSAQLRELAGRECVPLPYVILMIYASMLSLWCSQRDLTLLLVTHGRRGHPALKTMVGFLACCLHVRLKVRECDSLLDLLRQVAHECDAAFAHYHFDRVWDFIPECTTDVYVNWLPAPSRLGHVGGSESIQRQTFPLGLSWNGALHVFFSDTPAGITARVAYDPLVLTPLTLRWLESTLRSLARALLSGPLATLASVRAAVTSE